VIWKASTKVGFGFAGKSQSKFINGNNYAGQNVYVVANYQSAGNVIGQYGANVLPLVSNQISCPSSMNCATCDKSNQCATCQNIADRIFPKNTACCKTD